MKTELCLTSFTISVILFLLCSSMAFCEIIKVPSEYSTIQEAINNASPGDTLLVSDGTYSENLTVDKELIIKSVNGYNQTSVVGYHSDHIFEVTAENVTIEGFTIFIDSAIPNDLQAGIFLSDGSSHCRILNNRVGYDTSHKNGNGIVLENSYYNTISENTCSGNYRQGIELRSSGFNLIQGNVLNSNYWGHGILLQNSDDNKVSGNTCRFNNRCGICVSHSNSNSLLGNICEQNNRGIELGSPSNENIIIGNTCSENLEGIILQYASGKNILINNTCHANVNRGLYLYQSCNGNVISGNTFSENKYGLGLLNSIDNTIYLNNFLSSTVLNLSTGGSVNKWHLSVPSAYIYQGALHTGFLGNYFSDYSCIDENGDGISDSEYDLGGSEPDNVFPLYADKNNYTVVVLPSIPGDIDLDKSVDGKDLSLFAESFGKTE